MNYINSIAKMQSIYLYVYFNVGQSIFLEWAALLKNFIDSRVEGPIWFAIAYPLNPISDMRYVANRVLKSMQTGEAGFA